MLFLYPMCECCEPPLVNERAFLLAYIGYINAHINERFTYIKSFVHELLLCALQPQAGGGVVHEDRSVADILADDQASPAALALDRGLSRARLGRRRHARPQAVPAVPGRVQADPRRPLHDLRDGLAAHAPRPHAPVAVHGPQQRPRRNPGGVQPGSQRPDRARLGVGAVGQTHTRPQALLIALGAADCDGHIVVDELHVGHVQPRQFRAAKRPCEPNQQQRPVAQAAQRVRVQRADHGSDVGGHGGGLLHRGDPPDAADALHDRPDKDTALTEDNTPAPTSAAPGVDPAADYIIGNRIVAYHVAFARVVGSATAALLLSQLHYWANITTAKERDGWFYKAAAEIEDETGLTRREQETARRILRDQGVIAEDRRSLPAKLWYQVNKERLFELVREHIA